MANPSSSRDPRIDAYIAKSAEFARPILKYLRELVHEGCPQVQETVKWGMPSFEYKGILCGMAAFKQHCAFGFWKQKLVVGDDLREPDAKPAGAAAKSRTTGAPAKGAKPVAKNGSKRSGPSAAAGRANGGAKTKEAMGQFGRIAELAQLPPRRAIVAYVRKAAELNDAGIKAPRAAKKPKQELVTPPDLAAALKRNKSAAGHFAEFSYSKKKDYIEWLTDAKTEETRRRRLATAIEWIAEGKSRNWKYERC